MTLSGAAGRAMKQQEQMFHSVETLKKIRVLELEISIDFETNLDFLDQKSGCRLKGQLLVSIMAFTLVSASYVKLYSISRSISLTK